MKLPKILFKIYLISFLVLITFTFNPSISFAQSCDGSYECVSTDCGYKDSAANNAECDPNPDVPTCTYKCIDVTENQFGCSFVGGTGPDNCRLSGVASCLGGGGSRLKGKCVYSGPYVGPIGYNCVSNSCTAVYSGSYTYSSSTCNGACVVPPPPAESCGWFTNADQCYSAGGSQNCAVKNGSGECDCCTPQYTPSPPPPYGCSNNSCAQVDGPYSGDPSCASSCGIKCSITAPVDTKIASSNHNSKACNIQGQNNVNNPSKIDLNCSSQEHAGNTKNWRIQKLVIPDLNGVGANGIYTNNGTTVTDNTAGKVSLSAVNPFGAGTSTKKVNLDFNVRLTVTNPNGITDTACSNFTFNPTTTTGVYRASTKCGTQVNDNTQLRTNSLAIISANGWGSLSYNGSNVVDANSKSSNFVESFSSVTVGLITTYFYNLTFDVSVVHNVSTTINGITVFCEPILFPSSTSNYALGNISCRGNTTETDIRTVLLEKFNSTGLKTISMSVNNNIGTYSSVSGRLYKEGGAFTDSVSSFTATGNTYTNNITILWPDGIPYASRTIKMWITDGTADNTCGNVESSTPTCAYQTQTYTVDTSLPIVEREVTVDSTTLLKVVHKATDDYQLKSHAVYCGGTAYSDSTSSKSPFISERRLSSDGLSYSYIGAQQIAGYFGADPSIKTCDGSFLPVNNIEQNNDDFKTFATTAISDTRSTYYLLDENSLKNQNEPYEITFGDGKDGSALGRWYAEDSFCNLPATSPTTTVDVGSPWIQTKGGNAYVQGNNGTNRLPTDTFAYNYTVNNVNITTDPNNPGLNICTATKSLTNDQVKTYLGSKNQKSSGALSSYVNRINQCPENTDTYASSYVMSSAEESSSNGPRGGDRSSKINQESVEYNHKLNNISNYTGGDNNLFDYITKTINTAGIAGYYATGTQVTDTNSELVNESSQLVIKTYPGPTALTINPDAESGNDLLGIMDALITGPTVNGNAVSVYQINNADLIINHNSANLGTEAWEINRNAIILVDGDVYLEPDIIKNGGSLVIVAKGSIVIGNGKYKSAPQTKEQVAAGTAYPLYDQIDAFLIADGKVITLPDKGGSSYIASNPVKPAENIASKPEVKLNNEIIKKAEAQTYPCKVIYYKDSGFTQPFTSGEVVTPGQDLYLAVSRTAAGAFSNVGIANVGMRKGSTRINGVSLLGSNYQVTVTGSLITTGNNTFEWGYNLNYGNSSDATTGDWCEPFTLTGAVSLNVSGNVYCRDTNNNKSVVSGVTVSLVSGGTTTIGTTDANGNWSGSIYSNTNGSIRPSHTNYPNGANRLNKASGCFNSNLETISFKSNNTLIDETGQCGDSNQAYYQSTYSYGGETEDRNNLSLSSINFDLGSCVSQNLPTQCTAMTINEGSEDIALTPGSDINISMTVVNPTATTNKIVVSNRDHKCNDLRAYRAGLAATNINGYTNMTNSTNTPAQWADCIPPATATQITSVFDTSTYSDNGNLRTYTFKIKAEQVLKTDQNTGLPIKSIEFGGPNVISESLRCKVYAHDNRIVYDGLKIYGGIVQTSTFPKGNNLLHGKTVSMDGVNYSSSLTCKNSGGEFPKNPNEPTTGVGSPCFLRDLIMVQNFVAPAEQIEYDPGFQVIFGSILGRKSTILSIRESTDD